MPIKNTGSLTIKEDTLNEKKQPVFKVRSLCITAVMAALICILTMIPRVPIPLGYAHLGDAAIFLIALYVGRREGAIAASIGSAMADLLGGFPIWILATLVIKYIMVEIIWLTADDSHRLLKFRTFLGLFLSAIWMVISYTLAGALLYGGLPAGLTMVPGLIAEGLVNLAAAYAAGLVLERSGFFKR